MRDEPTIGKPVLYYSTAPFGVAKGQPYAATVVCVEDPRTVSLAVFDSVGMLFAVHSVHFLYDGEDRDGAAEWCTVTPYQGT